MSAKKLIFIRHGKADHAPNLSGEDYFDFLNKIAKREKDPKVDEEKTRQLISDYLSKRVDLGVIDFLATSPAGRCSATARLIQEYISANSSTPVCIQKDDNLLEVKFDLGKIYPESSIPTGQASKMNSHVLTAMQTGRHSESYQEVEKRVERAINNFPKGKDILVVTHDFIMRVFEIYIKDIERGNNELFNTKKYGYLEGFETDRGLSYFKYL